MNILNKHLIKDSLSNDKIEYYQKLRSKYTKAFTKYRNLYPKLNDFQEKVLDWFFSFDSEKKMIICSIENKRFTKIISKIYYHHKANNFLKFNIREDKDEPEYFDERKEINSNSVFSKNYLIDNRGNINQSYIVLPESFLDEIRFYQCESSIEQLDIYCSYFTLSEKVLNDRGVFVQYFDEISKGEFFKQPIKTTQEIELKESKKSYIQLPNWISDNANKYFSLSEYLVGVFEQAISVRYIMSYINNNSIDEVLKSSYLMKLFERRRELEAFLNGLDFKSMYREFNINELIKEIYNNRKIQDVVMKLTGEYETRLTRPMGWFANPSFFDATDNIDKIQKNIYELLCQFSTYPNPVKEFGNFVMFIHFSKLFGYEDFFIRGLFETIMAKYSQKVADEVTNSEEILALFGNKNQKKQKKKKKKKKSKNKNEKEQEQEKEEINEKQKQEISKEDILSIIEDIIKKALENINIEQKHLNNSEKDIINFVNNASNNKKEKKQKEKKFFLFDTIKHSKKKTKKQNQKTLPDNQKQEKKENPTKIYITQSTIHTKTIDSVNVPSQNNIVHEQNHTPNKISSNINSITITTSNQFSFESTHAQSSSSINIITNNNIDDNIFLINHNPIFLSFFDLLNNDINSYVSEEECFLSNFRNVKIMIKDFIFSITSNLYPKSTLNIYGSTLFKLDIESSDLDLCITTPDSRASLTDLIIYFSGSNINKETYKSITPILTASVPVIKLVINPLKLGIHKINEFYKAIHSSNYYTNYLFNHDEIDLIKVDITINSINPNQIAYVNNNLCIYPEMRPLIKIIKRLLYLKYLNNPYKGGMSSYCLFILVLSYMKWHISINSVKKEQKKFNTNSLGGLFIEFLLHYGTIIDFEHTIINPNLSK